MRGLQRLHNAGQASPADAEEVISIINTELDSGNIDAEVAAELTHEINKRAAVVISDRVKFFVHGLQQLHNAGRATPADAEKVINIIHKEVEAGSMGVAASRELIAAIKKEVQSLDRQLR